MSRRPIAGTGGGRQKQGRGPRWSRALSSAQVGACGASLARAAGAPGPTAGTAAGSTSGSTAADTAGCSGAGCGTSTTDAAGSTAANAAGTSTTDAAGSIVADVARRSTAANAAGSSVADGSTAVNAPGRGSLANAAGSIVCDVGAHRAGGEVVTETARVGRVHRRGLAEPETAGHVRISGGSIADRAVVGGFLARHIGYVRSAPALAREPCQSGKGSRRYRAAMFSWSSSFSSGRARHRPSTRPAYSEQASDAGGPNARPQPRHPRETPSHERKPGSHEPKIWSSRRTHMPTEAYRRGAG